MGIGAHLIHRCDVNRDDALATDPFGQDIKTPRGEPWLRDLHCRLVVKQERIVSDDQAELMRVTRYILLTPARTDVREGDEVTNVRDETGEVIDGVWTVKAIMPRRGRSERHRTLELQEVS